jgi:hypothetical protein
MIAYSPQFDKSKAQFILSRLKNVRNINNGWKASCPAHDDRQPSLSVSIGNDGRILLYCHAGCSIEEIVSALGLEMRDLFPEKEHNGFDWRITSMNNHEELFDTLEAALSSLTKRFGSYSNSWSYRDAFNRVVGVILRWDHNDIGDGNDRKIIRPVSRVLDGRWAIRAMPHPRPLYRLPEIDKVQSDEFIFVVEGEKCADIVTLLGLHVTTSSGGANAADKTDWKPLCGKHVVILPDNDPAGEHYANEVVRLCREAGAASIRILRLAEYATDLPVGGDIADIFTSSDWCGIPLGDAAELEDFANWLVSTAKSITPLSPTATVTAAEAVDNDILEFQPFPVDALPEPVRSFVVNGAQAIGCDTSYLALPLLTAIASAIGNTRRLELKRGWLVPPILWSVIVGESGTAKTPAFQLVLRPIYKRQQIALEQYAAEMKLYAEDLATWEKTAAIWKRDKSLIGKPPPKPEPPQVQRIIVSDTTVEALAPILLANPRGVLLARDELSGWFGSFDRYVGKGKPGTDLANWLEMFNGRSIIVDRKTGDPRTIFVPRAAVCVTGGIQPTILQRALSIENRESGLAARLLLTYPPRMSKRWTESDIDPDSEDQLVRLFDWLYRLKPIVTDDGDIRPEIVQLSEEAKAIWIDYYNEHATEQSEMVGDMASAWSKLEEYAARLALVIHFARWAAGENVQESLLDAFSMQAGITLAKWFKNETRRVYAILDGSDEDRDQRRLIEWIERKGGKVTVREVQMGCRWLRKSGLAEEALQELVKAGYGIWTDIVSGSKGGRPTRSFVLHSRNSASTKPPK